MTTLLASFIAPSRKGDAWFFAGLTSSFPNLAESGAGVLDEPRLCGNGASVPGCKVFHVPSSDSSQAHQIEGDAKTSHSDASLQDEVLIFQYRGKIHAVDNVGWVNPFIYVSMLSCHAEMPTLGVPVGEYDARSPSFRPLETG